jgi:hypothetical protein
MNNNNFGIRKNIQKKKNENEKRRLISNRCNSNRLRKRNLLVSYGIILMFTGNASGCGIYSGCEGNRRALKSRVKNTGSRRFR